MPLTPRTEALAASEPGRTTSWRHGDGEEGRFELGGRVAVKYSGGALYPGEVVGFDGTSSLYSVQCDDGELLDDVMVHEMIREEEVGLQLHLSSKNTSTSYKGVARHQGAAVVTEAEGLRLHLSSSSSTGYRGVYEHSGRFQARYRVDGRQVHLGHFDTAVEAAVAYARSVGQASAVAAEAEGLRLHLSSRSNAGYNGVREIAAGRFQTKHWVDGKDVYIGIFDTAVEAAVAYARAVGEAAAGEAVSSAAAAGEASDSGEGVPGGAGGEAATGEGSDAGRAPAECQGASVVAAEAEGLRLHLSSRSSTGYKNVVKDLRRFRAQHNVGSRKVHLGTFDTAVEAAVAYARAAGQAPAVATEAEGLRLYLSSSSSTGYQGVSKQATGRFKAERMVDGRMVYIGTFDMAVEAAVAYARAVGRKRPREEEEEEKQQQDEEEDEQEVEVEVEPKEAAAAAAEEPFNLPRTVHQLKRFFSNDVQLTAGFKPALEQMEVETYGAVKTGALHVRVRSLSLEIGL